MKKSLVLLRMIGILLVATVALFADVVSFTGLPANTDYNTYNGFVSGTIDGMPFDDLICDDYGHVTRVPSGNLDYNVSTLDSLQYARFVSPGGPTQADIQNYEAAAILVQGLIDNPGQVSAYQYALWELFTPSTPNYGQGLLTDALNAVQGDVSGYADLFSKLRIYTPTGDSVTNQEFLEIDPPPSSVPEPESIILLLTGVALMALALTVKRLRLRPGATETAEPRGRSPK
jgi:hypothetical protein